jgi:hypothetical protein
MYICFMSLMQHLIEQRFHGLLSTCSSSLGPLREDAAPSYLGWPTDLLRELFAFRQNCYRYEPLPFWNGSFITRI